MNRKPLLLVSLDRRLTVSLQDQLATGLRQKILKGVIPPGSPLPSSRELALELRVSRNTVISACDRLLGEGYLEAVPRSGLFVAHQLGDSKSRHAAFPQQSRLSRIRPVSHASLLEAAPFRPCRPDVKLFPLARWNRHRTFALKRYGSSLFQYQPSCALGLPALRQELARYLQESRGVRCDWNQVVITNGSQQALFLLSQLILKPRDQVVIEDPGYPGASNVFAHSQAKLVRMQVDDQGAIVHEKHGKAKLIYTTPSRQFPTGACMPVARRIAMLESAGQNGSWIVEDDYDSEFRYTRPPFPSLHSLARTNSVIYLGTMSKVLCPTLRIGYMVLPQELIEPFEKLRVLVDDQGPLIDQATLAYFISSGDFYSHIRKCRKVYGARLEVFLNSVGKYKLPLKFPFTDGGMNQAGFFDDPQTDDKAVSRRLGLEGFDIPALSSYTAENKISGLLFGFTAVDEKSISGAVQQLSRLL